MLAEWWSTIGVVVYVLVGCVVLGAMFRRMPDDLRLSPGDRSVAMVMTVVLWPCALGVSLGEYLVNRVDPDHGEDRIDGVDTR